MKEKTLLTLFLLLFLFTTLTPPVRAQLNDIQTSFEFDDADGRFTIGQCYGCALFEGGAARTSGNADLYLHGTRAWMIAPARTGSIEFVTPANRVRFFFKDEAEAVGSLLTLFDPDGAVVESFEGSPNGTATKGFTEILIEGTLIKKITLANQGSQAGPVLFAVIENFEASFEQMTTTLPVDTFYLPRFADGEFSAGGKRNIFRTEGILTNSGPFASVELSSFDDEGSPLEMTIEAPNRVTDSQFLFELLEGESLTLGSVGLGDGTSARNLILGYWEVSVRRVASDLSKTGSVGATAVFKRSQQEAGTSVLLFETGIPAVRPTQEFSISMDTTGARDTGLAIVHPPASGGEPAQSAAATVLLSVWDLKGEDLLASIQFELLPGRALSKFIWEYIRDFGDGIDPSVWNDLKERRAAVTVRSSRPVAAMTLRQDNPQAIFPEAIPSLTAFPVTTGAADSGIDMPR